MSKEYIIKKHNTKRLNYWSTMLRFGTVRFDRKG
jgi:hypothetical protein